MTLEQLTSKFVCIRYCGNGQYEIVARYRNRLLPCISTNKYAYNAWMCGDNSYYTVKQALQALYDECKRQNHVK